MYSLCALGLWFNNIDVLGIDRDRLPCLDCKELLDVDQEAGSFLSINTSPFHIMLMF